MYVDNAAMQLVQNPKQFDVIVTENLFGDILSDLASVLTGSIGLLPSASLNENGFGVYEPIHGSAPDIANKNVVNPIATILSVAMLFQHTFKRVDIYNHILESVKMVLNDGKYTKDLSEVEFISTSEMGDCIIQKLRNYIMTKKYNIAIVGATGAVGQMMIQVLLERKFPINELYLLASNKSDGKKLIF